jgi:predicted DNA-binding protein YlxM (UPF0122 family)
VIEYNGEAYLTATEIAKQFKVSRGTCYNNILRHVHECYLPGRKKALYRQSEIEQFSEVRIADRNSATFVEEVRPNVIAARRVV